MNDAPDPSNPDDSLARAMAETFARGGELSALELARMKHDLMQQIQTGETARPPLVNTVPVTRVVQPAHASRWLAAAVIFFLCGGLFYLCYTPNSVSRRPAIAANTTPENKPAPLLNARNARLCEKERVDGGDIRAPASAVPLEWKLDRTLSVDGQPYSFWSVAISPDGKQVVGTSVGTADVWDFATGKILFLLKGHAADTSIRACAYSPDSTRIVTTADDHTACIWDAQTGTLLHKLTGHTDALNYALFSPDSRFVLTAARDDTIRLWNAATGQPLKVFAARVSDTPPCAFSPDSKRLILPARNFAAKVYDVTTQTELAYIPGEPGGFASFSSDGKLAAASAYSAKIHIWNSDGTGEQTFMVNHAGGMRPFVASDSYAALIFSPDNRMVAVGCAAAAQAGEVRLLNLATDANTPLAGASGDLYPPCALTFSPDSQYLAVIERSYSAGLWSVSDGQQVLNLPGTTFIAFTPDGRHFLRIASPSLQPLEIYALAPKRQ